ncbi:haloacid dehalogenase [Streptomyces sp. WAC 06738]|uniref:HAD family hydrolase n=1 Tax=Streptomyces sp. WAC 06738 TaxID=2203210 RepID=UPI000F6C4137|nr:HAD family hydrolase [Streptomyces sp. WAC 06738]AZM50819.1 haloacid dehalogenase [Streptomyces sp. WAC 06738]
MPGAIELVIFDCDGVLVDSERIAAAAQVTVGAELGWPLTEADAVELFMGKSQESVGAMVVERLGPGTDETWRTRYYEEFFAGLDRLEAVPGVVDALDALAAAGLPTCVASSGGHERMRHTLGRTGLWDRFAGRIYSATDVGGRGKPAPDLFLHAAREMGYAPRACAVVEDSRYGVQAARAAGMRAYGFTGGLSPADWLAGPDTVLFDDMRKLPVLLESAGTAGTAD